MFLTSPGPPDLLRRPSCWLLYCVCVCLMIAACVDWTCWTCACNCLIGLGALQRNSVKQKWQNLEFDRASMLCWVEHVLPQISLNEERCHITHMFPIFLSKDDMLQVATYHFVPMSLLHDALFSFNMLIERENYQLYPYSNHTFSFSHFLFYILKVKKVHENVYTENKKNLSTFHVCFRI